MQRACDSCTKSYEALRPSSRFCSERCRKRAQRGHVVELPTAATPEVVGNLRDATLTELRAVDRQETALGCAALALAARIDSGADTGSAIASLTREWRATLAAATLDAKAASHVDELRAKRAARRSG